MKLLAFDFGTKKIGVAVGQTITKTAEPLNLIKIKNNMPDWIKIKKLKKEWEPNLIILGLPLNMNNTEQIFTRKTKKFANKLRNILNIPVELHDERLTTIEAKINILNNLEHKNLKKINIDSYSAVLILESWLKNNKNQFKNKNK
ncbi:Holliday junction resolvase RuvX [Candidatus Purcelliella pentastirinorum]|uniref:Putative pre-16S rRNA nuclease n=1 Tax=Candidatus Purcelliella pentastirinorum TaxID=472834 RepID=A0AAX3NAL3_9ENTR|nr:Holliday junction resolvase RuvX [Candidatus Purcelliella pentastirinorum]WDI78553.1 Holliday junction resolvase RuvX [Candidatus Purcelliella pentastirinorum]WDR80419.1 Holliday junction resolvase RuvX [Candidatus Purcelliella pentastirinorum]